MLMKGSARPVRGTLPYCVIMFPSQCVLSAAEPSSGSWFFCLPKFNVKLCHMRRVIFIVTLAVKSSHEYRSAIIGCINKTPWNVVCRTQSAELGSLYCVYSCSSSVGWFSGRSAARWKAAETIVHHYVLLTLLIFLSLSLCFWLTLAVDCQGKRCQTKR